MRKRIAAEIRGRAFHESPASESRQLPEKGECDPADLLTIIAPRRDPVGADEIHEHMFVHEGDAEPVGRHGPGDCFDVVNRALQPSAGKNDGGRTAKIPTGHFGHKNPLPAPMIYDVAAGLPPLIFYSRRSA